MAVASVAQEHGAERLSLGAIGPRPHAPKGRGPDQNRPLLGVLGHTLLIEAVERSADGDQGT
jgi:hypothetical protein